jgi:hypothetical protein
MHPLRSLINSVRKPAPDSELAAKRVSDIPLSAYLLDELVAAKVVCPLFRAVLAYRG